jgi:predicted dehydrogenase
VTHVGLIGCGNWGRYILRDLKTLGCEVSVVVHSSRGRANAEECGADRILQSVSEFSRTVEGFVVATPTVIHAATVESLLEFRRPIFVEKPLATDLAAARRLAENAGDRLFVMDKWRYHPGIEALRDLARSDELGPLQSIRTMRVCWENPHADVDAVWILMPHELAIVLEILGYIPDPVWAVAEQSQSEMTGLLGVLGTAPQVVVEVSTRLVASFRAVWLSFRDGGASLRDAYSPHIEIRRAAHGAARSDDPQDNRAISSELPLLRELRTFVSYLEGGPPPKSDAGESVRIVEVITKLRQLATA